MNKESFEHKGYKIVIEQEIDPVPPREDEQLSEFLTVPNQYIQGDKTIMKDKLISMLEEPHRDYIAVPVHCYAHSGVSISAETFSGRVPHSEWDSGVVGVIRISKAVAREAWQVGRLTAKIKEQVLESLIMEIQAFDQYLNGEVYGYCIFNQVGTEIDSCWGYYGLDYTKSAAKCHVDTL